MPHFKSTKARKENCLRAEIGQERCNHLSICPLVEVRQYQGVVKDDYCKYLSTCRLNWSVHVRQNPKDHERDKDQVYDVSDRNGPVRRDARSARLTKLPPPCPIAHA